MHKENKTNYFELKRRKNVTTEQIIIIVGAVKLGLWLLFFKGMFSVFMFYLANGRK